jgi:CRP-like cAMP-binding protein
LKILKVKKFSIPKRLIQGIFFNYSKKNTSFGEYSFFTGMPRKFTVQSTTFSKAFKITRKDILDCLQYHQKDRVYRMFDEYFQEKYCMIKDNIL